MMAARRTTERLIDRLPPVRGRYRENADLGRITWFRVGGPAEVMFRPADAEDLAGFLAARPEGVPVTVIGVGSNLLVRDGGVPGVVIRLGREFAKIEIDGVEVRAGAGALDSAVAKASAAASIAGLEFLAGIPGTIGGALRMNGGAYGREMKDVVIAAEAVAPDGSVHDLSPAALGFSYRGSAIAEDWIFTAARLRGSRGEGQDIARRIAEIQAARAETQPVRARTGGSTFRNPGGPSGTPKAWELIERAGCRGLVRGGARVSEQHCNFLINDGTATAADIEALGEEVRRRVKESTGASLEWEIRRIGIPAKNGPAAVQGAGS
ncbi:MAG: UDP-N-acetylmuramate dehydrogenase [Alphaproteobacteria bacterium]|nr:UDP-N-acetylmuramate dehydrogenase [Alphaproteobacteria bacterium]